MRELFGFVIFFLFTVGSVRLAAAKPVGSTHGGSGDPSAASASAALEMTPYEVSFKLDVVPHIPGEPAPSVPPGGVLRSGERFTLTAFASQSVYLYVIGYEQTDWSTLLFPQREHTKVKAGEKIRLPLSGKPFVLNNRPGRVSFFVYASYAPIDAGGCAAVRLHCPLWESGKEGTRGGDSKVKDPPPPPANGDKRTDRGGPKRYDAKEHIIVAKSDKKGIVLLSFSFEHSQ